MLCLTRFPSFHKIKRASRSLLRQVPKLSIPFETGVDFEKISFSIKDHSWGTLWELLLAPFWHPFWLHLAPLGSPWASFWALLTLLGLTWAPFGALVSTQGYLLDTFGHFLSNVGDFL